MNNCSAAPFLFLLYISQPPLTKSDSQPASQPATPTPTRPTSSTTINNMHSQTTDMNMKYPPMRTRCGRYDDSPGKSILLKHKDEGFVPSWRLPAHDAPVRESPRVPRRHPTREGGATRHCQSHRLAVARGRRLAAANRELRTLPVLLQGQERAGHLQGCPRDHQAGEQVSPTPA
jgi:hypothetical protein